jgi:hypothetical protein
MGFFEDSDYYTGPPVTDEAILAAEDALGYRLPAAYVAVLHERNGGTPRAPCFPTAFGNSWAPDHIAIRGILGVGTHWWGIDAALGSRYLITEWGYPNIGIVVCDTPSSGHDTVMLDYSRCGPAGEPSVAYVDEDRVPRQLAPTFDEFIQGLTSCSEFSID